MSNLQDRKTAAKAMPGPAYSAAGVQGQLDPGAIPPDDLFWKAAHAAKLFCIASAMLIPNLLVIYVLL